MRRRTVLRAVSSSFVLVLFFVLLVPLQITEVYATTETLHFTDDVVNVNGANFLNASTTAAVGETYSLDGYRAITSVYLYPTSDYSVMWSPSTGATNYGCIDEVSPSDTDYVYSPVFNNVDKYGHTAFNPPAGKGIAYVTIHFRYKGSAIAYGMEIGGTPYTITINYAANYVTVSNTWYLNPADGHVWEESDIDDLYLYIKDSFVKGHTNYVSWMRMTVGYYTNTNTAWAFKVWTRNSVGTETEITDGYQSIMTMTISQFYDEGGQMRSVEWECPETALAVTDNIVFGIYSNFSGSYQSQSGYYRCGTVQLGASQLDNANWTIYTYLAPSVGISYFDTELWFNDDGTYDSRIEGFSWSAPTGYELNLHVEDWDLADSIQNAAVTMNNGSDQTKVSNINGWANYTGVSGTVTVKVKCCGFWVNGTFSVTVDSDKTIDVQCRLYDVVVTVRESVQSAYLASANVTAFNSSSSEANKINSGITENNGQVVLNNLPNNTLTFTQYGGAAYSLVIGNVTDEVTQEDQSISLTSNQNYLGLSDSRTLIAWIVGVVVPLRRQSLAGCLKRKKPKKGKREV